MQTHWHLVALCTTAACIGIPLTMSGAVLHLAGSGPILFSALFFAGCGAGTVIGGRLADRVRPERMLLSSCAGVLLADIALPLWMPLPWLLLCRCVLGLWVGSVFVSGARFASLHQRALLAQGLYGGCLQFGAGLGVLLTPLLLSWLSWQGVLLLWALGSFLPVVLWLWLDNGSGAVCVTLPGLSSHTTGSLRTALRTPAIWRLGIIHTGTFGLGTAIAAWITVYFTSRYHLPPTVAATLGSLYVLAGIVLRPAGGLLVQRAEPRLLQVIQVAVLFTVLGVACLAIAPALPLALAGTLLLAVGMNLPYASVLTLAARYGRERRIGAGVAQGTVVMLLCLSLVLMPMMIGMGMAVSQPFTTSGWLFGGLALLAAWTFTRSPQHTLPAPGSSPHRSKGKTYNLLTAHPALNSSKEDIHVQ